jgi:transcriptional regulator with XRE-family HTH domain
MSPLTVTRLEKGNNEPESETVDLIAAKLGFLREFFFGDDIDDLDKSAASFRSLTSMTARERDAALASGSLAYLLSDYIAAKFNLPDPKLIDLSHERDPVAAARTLRQVWALGEQPISNMIKLLESKGVRVSR